MRILLSCLIFCYASYSCAVTLTLPKPTGPYAVGTRGIEFRDSTRQMLRGGDFKRWMVQAYYPSVHHEETYGYMPGTLDEGIVWGITIQAHAKPDADPLIAKKFPVMIFVPGRGGERQLYTILCEELASQGMIVLAMDQPYVANFVKFPDGATIGLSLKDVWYLPRDRNYRYAYDDAVIAGAMGDVAYVLDHQEALGTLTNLCDFNKVILMGHSLGGNVAHILGFKDKRVRAIVDIDSKITDRAVFGHVGVPENMDGKPVYFIRGQLQYQEDVGTQLSQIENNFIWSANVQHSAFSDNAFFAHKIPGFGTYRYGGAIFNWALTRGPYWSAVDTNLGESDVDTWIKDYRASVVSWLKNQAFK